MSTSHEISTWRAWARRIKRDLFALYLAYRDPRTPWYARVVAACVVAYAFSPIDLIPDPIPVLGYLDDLLLVPLGIMLAVRLVPTDVMAECRVAAATRFQSGKPVNWVAAAVIVCIWLLVAASVAVLVARWFGWLFYLPLPSLFNFPEPAIYTRSIPNLYNDLHYHSTVHWL